MQSFTSCYLSALDSLKMAVTFVGSSERLPVSTHQVTAQSAPGSCPEGRCDGNLIHAGRCLQLLSC